MDGRRYEFEFPFTPWDRLRAHLSLTLLAWHGWIALIVIPAFGAGLLAYLALVHPARAMEAVPFALFLLALPLILAAMLYRAFSRKPIFREKFRVVLDDIGLHIHAESYDYTHKWTAIRSASIRSGFLMLFFQKAQAHCFPLAEIERAGGLGEMRAFLAARGVKTEFG